MMQIGAAELTLAGFVGTWLVIAFAIGTAYGRLSSRIAKNSTDITAIQSQFTTQDGEQRLLSFRAHDHICRRTTEAMLSEFRHVTQALNASTAEIREMKQTMNQMTVAIAVLEEDRDEKK